MSKIWKIARIVTKSAVSYAATVYGDPLLGAMVRTTLDVGELIVDDFTKTAPGHLPTTIEITPERPLPETEQKRRLLITATRLRSAGYSAQDQLRGLGLYRPDMRGIGYSAHDQLKELGLHQQNIRQSLQMRALSDLSRRRDEQAANDCITLLALEKYEFFNSAELSLFFRNELKKIIQRTPSLQHLLAIVLQREADMELRDPEQNKADVFESYGQIGERFKLYGDTHGLYDCLWRQSHAYFDRGDISTARSLLRKSYTGLESADYFNDPRIISRPPNDRDIAEKVANVARSMALIHMAEDNLIRAEQLLGYAWMIYVRTGNTHGVANTFRTRAMLERRRGPENYLKATGWLPAAQRKFKSVDDQFAIAECQTIIDGSSGPSVRE